MTTTWESLIGYPYLTVSACGIANSRASTANGGAHFGPDTTLGGGPGTTGATTTTMGIQEAINWASPSSPYSNPPYSQIVFLLNQGYAFTPTAGITLASNVALLGNDTLVKFTNQVANPFLAPSGGIYYRGVVKGLIIDGGGSNGNTLLGLYGAQRCEIDVTLQDGATGLFVGSGGGTPIESILGTDAVLNRFNLHILNPGEYGINLGGASSTAVVTDSTFESVYISGVANYGIWLNQWVDSIDWENVWISMPGVQNGTPTGIFVNAAGGSSGVYNHRFGKLSIDAFPGSGVTVWNPTGVYFAYSAQFIIEQFYTSPSPWPNTSSGYYRLYFGTASGGQSQSHHVRDMNPSSSSNSWSIYNRGLNTGTTDQTGSDVSSA